MNFFKKIVFSLIIVLLVFSSFNGVFVNQVRAAQDLSDVITQAGVQASVCTAMSVMIRVAKVFIGKAMSVPEKTVAVILTVPTTDTTNSSDYTNAISYAWDDAKVCIKDSIKSVIMAWVVDQVVDWIQNGGDLSSRFATDWAKDKTDAFNAGAGAAIGSAIPYLCSPFKAQVQLSFMPVEKFTKRISCTLDKVTSNINNFYNDFSDGGWLAYNAMWEPQNNFFGVSLMMNDEATGRGSKKAEAAINDAIAGAGFKSSKSCKEVLKAGDVLEDPWGGPDISITTASENVLKGNNEPTNMEQVELKEIADALVAQGTLAQDTNDRYCFIENLQNATPGRVAGDMAQKYIVDSNSDLLKALGDSEDWGKWITAIVDAATNRLMKEGLGVIKGSGRKTSAGATKAGVNAPSTYKLSEQEIKDNNPAKKALPKIAEALPIKISSYDLASSSLKMFDRIKNNGCGNDVVVSDKTITYQQIADTKTTLENEVNGLTDLSNKAQKSIDLIEFSSATATSTMQAIQEFNDAFEKSGISGKLMAGTYKTESQTQLTDLQSINSAVKAKWLTCANAIKINSGSASTVSGLVDLSLDASKTETPNPTQMMISNDSDFSGRAWEYYSTVKYSWSLTSGSGTKTVYVKFKDATGKISDTYGASITLTSSGN
ncbi:hypothetical protein HZB04_00335 [Candidatus Wolfebacteria bacterium]|nr:hypothetical protein [Candidatus Wolfebacteria bacterium]